MLNVGGAVACGRAHVARCALASVDSVATSGNPALAPVGPRHRDQWHYCIHCTVDIGGYRENIWYNWQKYLETYLQTCLKFHNTKCNVNCQECLKCPESPQLICGISLASWYVISFIFQVCCKVSLEVPGLITSIMIQISSSSIPLPVNYF